MSPPWTAPQRGKKLQNVGEIVAVDRKELIGLLNLKPEKVQRDFAKSFSMELLRAVH